MDIQERALEALYLYRITQQCTLDIQTLEQAQTRLLLMRRNYAISHKFGRQWEHGIHQHLHTKADTKLEFHKHYYGQFRVMPPFVPSAFGKVDLDSPIATIDTSQSITIELREFRYGQMGRLLAYNAQMNTLYVGID